MPITPGRGILAALVAAAPLLAQTVPVKEHTLSNGMRLLLVERHDEPTIAAGWVARVGSANEAVGATGMAHFFEHMMFKGTTTIGTKDAKRDAELNGLQDKVQANIREEIAILREKQRRGEIADIQDPKVRSERHQQLLKEFDALVKEQRAIIVKDEMDLIYKQAGATGLNANTSNDRTYYHITVPANKLELWAWMESDRLKNAVFREFYSERDVILEERRQSVDATPTGKIMEAFFAMTWEAHPYRWPVLGWPSDISQVNREVAERFFATYYAPNNLTTVLVGDFKTDEAIQMMERYFGRIPRGTNTVPAVLTTDPARVAPQRMDAEAESTPMVFASYKGVPSVHQDAAALDILGSVLNGQSGRLNKELVLKQKSAAMAQAFNRTQKYAGSFFVIGAPTPEKKNEDVEPMLYAEIEKIQKDGITDQELQKVKNQVLANSYRRLESNGGLAAQLAEAEGAGSYKDFLTRPEMLQKVTKDDVQRVAKKYFTPENRSVLTLRRKAAPAGPEDPELAKLPEQFRSNAKMALAQFEKETDIAKLKEGLGQMEAQAEKVPPQVKPLIEFLMQKLRARIQKLEAK
ncbi:MAG: pitrilysin family protein [Holophaga sp.]|nr:pitrilysin family protein [Holophaga sp.]